MQSRKADPRWMDRYRYDCPYCEKGEAVFFGTDSKKERISECNNCGRKLGESALKSAARERFLADYKEPGDRAGQAPLFRGLLLSIG
jgi:hypothetical protein